MGSLQRVTTGIVRIAHHAASLSRRVFVVPFAVVIIGTFLVPVLYLFEMSFHARDPLGGVLGSYSLAGWAAFVSATSLIVVLRSIGIAAAVTVVSVALAVPVGLFVLSCKPERRASLVGLLCLPLILNPILFAYGYVLLFTRDGPLNTLLLKYRIVDSALPILFTPAAVAIGLVSSYFSLGFVVVLSGLVRIEERYSLVAEDLGASPAQQLFTMTLPLLRPSCLAAAALVFIPALGEFLVPTLLGGGKVLTYGTLLQAQFTTYSDWPAGAALGCGLVIVGLGLELTALGILYSTGHDA